jgi:hypothetical protein
VIAAFAPARLEKKEVARGLAVRLKS